jgi:hypothetical protein
MLNGNMSGCDVSSDTGGPVVDIGESTDTDTGDSTDTDTGDSTKVSNPDGIIDKFSVVGDDEKRVCGVKSGVANAVYVDVGMKVGFFVCIIMVPIAKTSLTMV